MKDRQSDSAAKYKASLSLSPHRRKIFLDNDTGFERKTSPHARRIYDRFTMNDDNYVSGF